MSVDDGSIIQLEPGWSEINLVALDVLQTMLEEGFKPGRLFSNNDYSRTYTMCYNMCTQKTPFNWSEQLYVRHGESISKYLLTKVVPVLRGLQDEALLREFVRRADNHSVMNKWYAKFFMYLDRYHVKYHQLPVLSEAGLRLFKTLVFANVKGSVAECLLRLVRSEREGQLVDRDLIRRCVEIFEQMGMGTLEAYEADFEAPFLDASKEHYAQRAASWIASESTPSYLVRVERALEEEKQRVANLLNASTEPKLLQVMDKELLEKQLAALLEKEGSGCKALLANHSIADLHRLYYLLQRIPHGLDPMAAIFKRHLLDVGQACIDLRLGGQGASSGSSAAGESKESKQDSADARENEEAQFVKDFIGIHEKYVAMVRAQFNNHHLFEKALQEAFVELINKDSLVSAGAHSEGGAKFKSAELMANFCDRLLRKNTTEKLSDEDIEAFLEQTVALFMYLSDKDFFSEVYRNQLAKRLLNQRSASDDMERAMIGKLKSRSGAQFTAKMEGMLTDLAIGQEQSAQFEKFCKDHPDRLGKLSFSVQILTTGHWPQYKPYSDIVLPPVMLKCMETFKTYYDAMTNSNKRKLTWVYSLGNVSLKGSFNGFKKSYDINVTTVQAAVLLMFNTHTNVNTGNAQTDQLLQQGVVSFAFLQETLNMPEDVLKKVLHSLCYAKFKVLKKVGAAEVNKILGVDGAGEEEKDAKPVVKKTDHFQFNDAFSCPMRQIRIPMALLEDSHSAKKVEENRGHAIEAAIVRTMKARKQLGHQQLLAEVLSQLAFFKPDPKAVKKHIESLIEREFLERDPENPSTYRYLA